MSDPAPGDGGATAESGRTAAESAPAGQPAGPVDARAGASVGVVVAAAVLGGAALPGPAGWRTVAAVLRGTVLSGSAGLAPVVLGVAIFLVLVLGVGTVLALGLRRRGVVDRFEGGLVALGVTAVALPGPAGWRTVAAALGVATALAFGLRHLGVLDRLPGAALAAVASLAVAGYGLGRLVLTSSAGATPGSGPWVAAGAGLLGVAFAYADWAAIPRAGIVSRFRGTTVGVALGATGFLGILVWANVLAVLVVVFTGDLGDVSSTAIGALGLGFGTGTVGLVYLGLTDQPLSYIDFRMPDLRDAAYALGGIVALFGLLVGLSFLFALLGTSPAEHSVVEQAEQNPAILLVLIPAAWLFIGPGEELLFRNVVQKSLYDAFSRPGAILVASGIFAAAHFQAYFDPNPVSLLQSLGIVFALSLVLGALYERTGNTTVPAFVHGTYNAVLFIVLYLGQTGNDGGTAATVAALLVP